MKQLDLSESDAVNEADFWHRRPEGSAIGSYGRVPTDMHGRPFETAPGVQRGTHEWRIDYGGAFDQWFCPHCSVDWFEFDEDEPMTPCVRKADVHA